MNGIDYLILILIAGLIALSVRLLLRRKKKGTCCGECSACADSCKKQRDGE